MYISSAIDTNCSTSPKIYQRVLFDHFSYCESQMIYLIAAFATRRVFRLEFNLRASFESILFFTLQLHIATRTAEKFLRCIRIEKISKIFSQTNDKIGNTKIRTPLPQSAARCSLHSLQSEHISSAPCLPCCPSPVNSHSCRPCGRTMEPTVIQSSTTFITKKKSGSINNEMSHNK